MYDVTRAVRPPTPPTIAAAVPQPVPPDGPLWVITDNDFGGDRIVHARIVTAVRGDGTPEGTTVTLADSASGGIEAETFSVFAGRLEASEAVRFGTGVFHW